MPAKKPNGLITRARTKEESEARAAGEKAMQPTGDVFARVPAALKSHAVATTAWKRLAENHYALPEENRWLCLLDLDMLVDYCLLFEQVVEMDAVRAAVVKKLTAKKKPKSLDDIGVLEDLVKLDARVDRKRALLMQLRQSLYMTPRARAGVVPDANESGNKPLTKEEQEEKDMEALLDDVRM